MFVHVHIPIIDCRGLCSTFRRLKRPAFPLPESCEFIRHFGDVRSCDPAWPYTDENCFFRGQNAVRFVNLPQYDLLVGNKYHNCLCKFRRLYSSGCMPNRYELGMEFTASIIYVNKIIDFIFNQKIKVWDCKKDFAETTLKAAGKHLAKLYGFSTTNQGVAQDSRVSSGETLCILESAADEELVIPATAELVLEFRKERVSLFHFIREQARHYVHCWVIQKKQGANTVFASKLRNALFQVHLESQALIHAYKFLIDNDDIKEIRKEALLRFISTTQIKLKRRVRFEISTERIVNIALKATHAIQPCQMSQMIDMVDRIGDKYLTADFLELMSPLSIAEWKEQIELELQKNWTPGTKTQLEYLRKVCDPSSFKQFLRFIVKFKGEIWDIAKDLIVDRLKK